MQPENTRRTSLARRPSRRGTTTVEMAFCAPVLLLIVFGLMDISYAFLVQHLIQDAARQACRAAITGNSTNADLKKLAQELIQGSGAKEAKMDFLVNGSAAELSTAKPGDSIQVQIQVDACDASIFPGGFFVRLPLAASSSIRRD